MIRYLIGLPADTDHRDITKLRQELRAYGIDAVCIAGATFAVPVEDPTAKSQAAARV